MNSTVKHEEHEEHEGHEGTKPSGLCMRKAACCVFFVCFVGFVCPREASAQGAPTFSGDVAPIVFEACTPCHRQGGPGPFSLASYKDVRQRASQIVQVTERLQAAST